MAELLDERQEEPTETLELEEQETHEVEEPQEPVIPEKYRGKSVEDLVRMHQEAESLIGRQSQEVGELRKTFDSYVMTQLNAPKNEPEEDVDFFVDPEKAVARAIESNPKLKEAEAVVAEYRKSTALSQLTSKHPDMKDILGDQNFQDWVQGSKIRTQLFKQADSNYDYEAADELFSLWKERKTLANETAKVEKKARDQQAKQAATGKVRGSAEPSSRKVYRRADIRKLMTEDPDRYMQMAPEIRQAYAEGRVR